MLVSVIYYFDTESISQQMQKFDNCFEWNHCIQLKNLQARLYMFSDSSFLCIYYVSFSTILRFRELSSTL